MKKFLTLLLIALLMLPLAACGGQKEANLPVPAPSPSPSPAPAPAAPEPASNPNLGKWLAHSVNMFEMEMNSSEVWEKGFTVELLDGGKAALDVDGQKLEGTWKLEGDALTVTTANINMPGSFDGNLMYLKNVLDAGMDLTFYKEGTPQPPPVVSALDEISFEETPSEPEVPSEAGSLAGDWYGNIYVAEATDNFFLQETLPVWGYVGEDSSGMDFLEVYFEEDMNPESAVVSMWIEDNGNSFTPIIGDEDSWIFDLYLFLDEAEDLTGKLDENGALIFRYTYVQEDGEGADLMFYLMRDGETWIEPASELFTKGTGIEIDITDGLEFTLGPAEDYAKSGWVHNKTGTIRMRLPEGWYNGGSSNAVDFSMRARSAPTDGNLIDVYLKEYSSMLKEEKNAKNQMLLGTAEESILTDTYGAYPVWYKLLDGSEESIIQAYADYDDEYYVYIAITVHKSFGTLDDFKASPAWQTFVDSLYIQP